MAKRFTTEEAIARFRSIHGDRYDYSRVEYVNNAIPVIIGCRVHGWFQQSPNSHISQRAGCHLCGFEKRRAIHQYDTQEFVARAQAVHGDKYDYSQARYLNSKAKVTIVCRVHGPFLQDAAQHIKGQGCRLCANEAQRMLASEFIERATALNANRYDYSRVVLNLSDDKVLITCPDHGDFWQIAIEHLRGKPCPACSLENRKIICKSWGEEAIAQLLHSLGIAYERQKTFLECRLTRPLPFDFYFVRGNRHYLVEYDGEQHYRAVEYFGGEKDYRRRVVKDEIKSKFAAKCGYVLIRIPYTANSDLESYLLGELSKYA